MNKKNIIFLLPIIWFISGVLYARTLESFAGIGFFILTLITFFGILIGTIVYRIKNNPIFSVITTIISTIIIFLFVIILSRFY